MENVGLGCIIKCLELDKGRYTRLDLCDVKC